MVNIGDYKRLKPEVYLNDNLIDFYLKYTTHQRFSNFGMNSPPEFHEIVSMETYVPLTKQVHVFSSHFFTTLTNRNPQEILDPKGKIYILLLICASVFLET